LYILWVREKSGEDEMNATPVSKIFFLLAFFSVAAFAGETGDPVVIDPSIQNYSGLFSQKLAKKYVIDEVIDKRKNAGSDTIGATRTGRFVTSPLLCRPLPTAVMLNSLTGMFRELGVLAEDKSAADFLIDVEVLECTVEEMNKVFSQQIKATLKFRVKVRTAASGALVNQFVIKSEDARSAVDTTPFAVKVTTNAVVAALQNLLDSLVTIQ
jgi:hypothetical protein